MTQEQSRRRRYNRADRNRPMLVTSSSESETSVDDTEIEQIETAEETPVVKEAPAAPQKTRRLPGFFSTIGKKPTEETPDVAQARLARATRKAGTGTTKATDTTTTETTTTEEKQEKQETKPKPTPARPTPPRNSGFKTRYLLGMVIYLLGANFIGVFETQFMTANKLNHVLTTFNLFGGQVIISTATIVFLATLIILLIVLAKLDLIPRSLGALAGMPEQPRSGQAGKKSTSTNQELTSRTPPPTMKQGIKGADDDIYADYRADQRYWQRRARKRS